MSPIVRAISSIVVGGAVVLLAGEFSFLRGAHHAGLYLGLALGLLALGCFLRSPVAYEIDPNRFLIVRLRMGMHRFGPVKKSGPATEPISLGVRLWGNGGLFAVTGLFWNRQWGKFRAYVTNIKEMVVIELEDGRRVLISPVNAQEWIFGD